jgi:hypothetical protein
MVNLLFVFLLIYILICLIKSRHSDRYIAKKAVKEAFPVEIEKVIKGFVRMEVQVLIICAISNIIIWLIS